MNAKYNFRLRSQYRRRDLPPRIIIGQEETESATHVLLKLLGFVLFYRERLQIEPRLPDDNIGFEPDLIQLDYTLRPVLWVECGECSVSKLDKLAVKVPEAEIWVVKRSVTDAQNLCHAMAKSNLRRERYGIIGLEAEMFEELAGLLGERNELFWVTGEFDPPHLQFDFNGLWFDASFALLRF